MKTNAFVQSKCNLDRVMASHVIIRQEIPGGGVGEDFVLELVSQINDVVRTTTIASHMLCYKHPTERD